jgi:hypothetical protein
MSRCACSDEMTCALLGRECDALARVMNRDIVERRWRTLPFFAVLAALLPPALASANGAGSEIGGVFVSRGRFQSVARVTFQHQVGVVVRAAVGEGGDVSDGQVSCRAQPLATTATEHTHGAARPEEPEHGVVTNRDASNELFRRTDSIVGVSHLPAEA